MSDLHKWEHYQMSSFLQNFLFIVSMCHELHYVWRLTAYIWVPLIDHYLSHTFATIWSGMRSYNISHFAVFTHGIHNLIPTSNNQSLYLSYTWRSPYPSHSQAMYNEDSIIQGWQNRQANPKYRSCWNFYNLIDLILNWIQMPLTVSQLTFHIYICTSKSNYIALSDKSTDYFCIIFKLFYRPWLHIIVLNYFTKYMIYTPFIT